MTLAIEPERDRGQDRERLRLEALLREAIAALAALDAERIEEISSLVESARFARGAEFAGPVWPPPDGPVEWPRSAAEWRRAAAAHGVLGHLVEATSRQIAVQRRIAGPGERFREYRPEARARWGNRRREPQSRSN
jgi:hypothetical protein